jgi:hypothetical protein
MPGGRRTRHKCPSSHRPPPRDRTVAAATVKRGAARARADLSGPRRGGRIACPPAGAHHPDRRDVHEARRSGLAIQRGRASRRRPGCVLMAGPVPGRPPGLPQGARPVRRRQRLPQGPGAGPPAANPARTRPRRRRGLPVSRRALLGPPRDRVKPPARVARPWPAHGGGRGARRRSAPRRRDQVRRFR